MGRSAAQAASGAGSIATLIDALAADVDSTASTSRQTHAGMQAVSGLADDLERALSQFRY